MEQEGGRLGKREDFPKGLSRCLPPALGIKKPSQPRSGQANVLECVTPSSLQACPPSLCPPHPTLPGVQAPCLSSMPSQQETQGRKQDREDRAEETLTVGAGGGPSGKGKE